jgi:hypothetical protein
MPFIPKRPLSLEHLSDDAAARALSRHFGDIVEAAKDLGVNRKDLRRLTWHNPGILHAAHERMSLFVHHMWGEPCAGSTAGLRAFGGERLIECLRTR